MILIIDEWLWHDLAGENGKEKQKETFKFLKCILKICDKIAIMRDSPFVKKFWFFSKRLDPEIVKFFKSYFLFNSNKCDLCDYIEEHSLPGIKPDDLYLYNLYLYFEKRMEECVITTDKPLIEIFRKEGLKVIHRDEFLKEYLTECKKCLIKEFL